MANIDLAYEPKGLKRPVDGSTGGLRPLGDAIRKPFALEVVPYGGKRGLLSGAALKSGYLPKNAFLDQLLNRGLALVMLVLTAPLLLVIMIAVKGLSKGTVFYRGARLGKDQKTFFILKFRTLDAAAVAMTKNRTLPRRSQIETRIGSYLRASRLDELPQIINILMGDMVFFGPRPVRAEMQENYANEAPGYEQRFLVRPGLVGLAQALMTHETPKRVRARFNSMCCKTAINYPYLLYFVARVGLNVLKSGILSFAEALHDLVSPMGAHRWLRSGFSRPTAAGVEYSIDGTANAAALCGLSDEVVQFVATQPLPLGKQILVLTRKRKNGRVTHVSVDADIQTVLPVGIGQSGFVHYANYHSTSPVARYRIERYFLKGAVIAS